MPKVKVNILSLTHADTIRLNVIAGIEERDSEKNTLQLNQIIYAINTASSELELYTDVDHVSDININRLKKAGYKVSLVKKHNMGTNPPHRISWASKVGKINR